MYNAQKSPLYALSDSFMGDAKDKKDVRKKPKKIAVKQIVEVLLLLSNMPALGKCLCFFIFFNKIENQKLIFFSFFFIQN